jgi:hypothetical protein
MIAAEMSDRDIGDLNVEKNGLTCVLYPSPAVNDKVEQAPTTGRSEYDFDLLVCVAGRRVQAPRN